MKRIAAFVLVLSVLSAVPAHAEGVWGGVGHQLKKVVKTIGKDALIVVGVIAAIEFCAHGGCR